MTTFEDYFEEHKIPLIFDDGDIELPSGYRVGHAYYDEFEEYLPVLNVIKTINNKVPKLITDDLESFDQYSIELDSDSYKTTITVQDDELSITQKNKYQKSTITCKDGGRFEHVNTIQFSSGTDIRIDELDHWLDVQTNDSHSISTLLSDTHTQLQTALNKDGFDVESYDSKSDEFTYRRTGNSGNLKELVQKANLGKLLSRPHYDGALILTKNDWLMDCLDYQKDGKRFIRTEIFWDQSDETENYKRRSAVKGLSYAYQMIPAERFEELSHKLLTNLQEFAKICYTQTETLDFEFQKLNEFEPDGADTRLSLTPEDLAWEDALYL